MLRPLNAEELEQLAGEVVGLADGLEEIDATIAKHYPSTHPRRIAGCKALDACKALLQSLTTEGCA